MRGVGEVVDDACGDLAKGGELLRLDHVGSQLMKLSGRTGRAAHNARVAEARSGHAHAMPQHVQHRPLLGVDLGTPGAMERGAGVLYDAKYALMREVREHSWCVRIEHGIETGLGNDHPLVGSHGDADSDGGIRKDVGERLDEVLSRSIGAPVQGSGERGPEDPLDGRHSDEAE